MPNLNVGLGLAVATGVAQADEYVYVLANCDTVSPSSIYYSYCNESDMYPACGSDIAVACGTIDATYSMGVIIEFNNIRYLVCFHNDDSAACHAAARGCNSDVADSSYPLMFKEDSITVGSPNRLENIEQLKCCYTYVNPGMVDEGNGVQCHYSTNYCGEDGTITSENPLCQCSPGYYSAAEYPSAPGANYMHGYCLPCDGTEYATGNNTQVSVPPTSNGGGGITSCFLNKGTQGIDTMGLWEIVDGNCNYSQ